MDIEEYLAPSGTIESISDFIEGTYSTIDNSFLPTSIFFTIKG